MLMPTIFSYTLLKCEKKLKEGGDQTCRICNVTKSIELFERPFLTMCKSCAADKATKTVECDVCHKVVQYGNYAKHKKTKRCLASSCCSNCRRRSK
jgi:hypothetical protein